MGLLLALALAAPPATARTTEPYARRRDYFSLSGSADWELYRSRGVSESGEATVDAVRQKYAVDLAGFVWDPRFNRFWLGADFFRVDRTASGQEFDSEALGYRASTIFFPNRLFPLRLFARRSTTDTTAISLAANDRETAAWGAEWNIATRGRDNFRFQYERTGYDLVSPLAFRERRRVGLAEFQLRSNRRETALRYNFNSVHELVADTGFSRQGLTFNDRTRFDGGLTLLFGGSHTMSHARFVTGAEDDLTQSRASLVLDRPRRHRVGVSFGYDFNSNAGKFVDSVGHQARTRLQLRMGRGWEWDAGVNAGRITTQLPDAVLEQELAGATTGVRFSRAWRRSSLSVGAAGGQTYTRFQIGDPRLVTNYSGQLDLHVPLFFMTLSHRRDVNDTTGVGFTMDESRAMLGLEGGQRVRTRTAVYRRDVIHDTFQFGVQQSTELGVETSLSHPWGGVSLTASTREGISDFIPDPIRDTPFPTETDLVNRADIGTLGVHWRIVRRLRLRIQGRIERREFSTLGREQFINYHPMLEWSSRVWHISLSHAHYERANGTTFEQDTWLLKISRRFL